jgi:hypothetical protein
VTRFRLVVFCILVPRAEGRGPNTKPGDNSSEGYHAKTNFRIVIMYFAM